MAPQPSGSTSANRQIKLPQSSTRLQRGKGAHCRVLTRVSRAQNYSLGFEGEWRAPGAIVEAAAGSKLVVLECAGPVGALVDRRRESVWILWRYEWESNEWREIARAAAAAWEWAVVLREPAYQALAAEPKLYDVLQRARTVAAELTALIVDRVSREDAPVRASLLAAVYDRLAGQLAEIRE